MVRTLDSTSLARMLGALAIALSFGAAVASLAGDGEAAGYAVVMAVMAWLVAVAIAAVLVGLAAAVRALRRRPARPPGRVIAAALAVGGLIVFPAYSNFYTDGESAATGGGVGYCAGALPLAQMVQNQVADDPHVSIYYSASCDD